ncbi:helix-turn-helix domain-containing protein [Enterobacter asburiae]
MITIAEKVKTYRLRKAWSQEQLAEVASLSVRTVQRTEKGQKPSLETLSALASAFGVDVSELSEETYVASQALDEHINQAKIQVDQETRFYRILITAVLVCTALMIINYLFTPKSYWSVLVAVVWGGLVVFRAIRVFIMRGKIALWQQRRFHKILRSGHKRPCNKTTER